MTHPPENTGDLRKHVQNLEAENARLRAHLEHVLHSRSWRWTLPIRIGQQAIRRFRRWLLSALHRHFGPREILYLDSRLPFTDRDAGSVRLFAFLRLLAGTGQRVTFVPFDLKDYPGASAAVRSLGVRVLCDKQIDSISAHLQAEGWKYDTVIVCRVPYARHYIEDIERFAPRAKIIFDTVDLHFLRLARQADLLDDNELRKEALVWKAHETDLMRRADCTIVVSEVERAILADMVPEAAVFRISCIHEALEVPTWNKDRTNILYLGNFYHEPNVDAVRHLVHVILPLVHRVQPGIVLEIAGGYPPGTIEDLAGEHVRVHGQVGDLAPYFARAKVFAAPLRFGAGVKGKLHMSMAYGVPFVTTSVGAEGMHVSNGESAFIADDDQAFAESIVNLCTDRALWERMAMSAQGVLREYFSPEAAKAEMERMFAFLSKR